MGAGDRLFLVLRRLHQLGDNMEWERMAVISSREKNLAEKCCLLGREAINYFTDCISQELLVNYLCQQ